MTVIPFPAHAAPLSPADLIIEAMGEMCASRAIMLVYEDQDGCAHVQWSRMDAGQAVFLARALQLEVDDQMRAQA